MRDQTHNPDLSNLSENLPILQTLTVLFGTVGKYDFPDQFINFMVE